jgi:opine dehydrogenase
MRAVAVLGGGNGSYAAAADLATRGFRVRLWRRQARLLEPLGADPTLTLIDSRGEHRGRLELATADLGEALRNARLVVAPLPAFAQPWLAEQLAPHLADGQILYIPPGTLGSLAISRALRRRGCHAEVSFVESGTLPYLARKRDEQTVVVTARAVRLPSGAHPASESATAIQAVREAYPALEPRRDVLDAALLNAGPIIHPPLILLNAAAIEAVDRYDIHAEGTQPSVRSVQDALDAERIAVREALGYPPPHFPLRDHYSPAGEPWMYGHHAHERLVASENWREPLDLRAHRYMLEDVECGLVLLESLAGWAGVPSPVATGLVSIASAILGRDLRRTGRTLGSIAGAGLDREGMARWLAEGLTPAPA